MDHLREAAVQENCTCLEVLEHAASRGIRSVTVDGRYWIENEAELDGLLQKTKMRIDSAFGNFDLAHDHDLDKAEELISFAAKHGVRNVLLVPGFVHTGEKREEVMERIAGHLQTLVTSATTQGVTCSLEDYDHKDAPFGTWQELKWFVTHVEGLGITFDTGNFAYFNQDARESLNELLPYVTSVHCKDRSDVSLRGEEGLICPDGRVLFPCAVGEGTIPMEQIVKTLMAAGYDGTLAIEHYGCSKQFDAIAMSADYLASQI